METTSTSNLRKSPISPDGVQYGRSATDLVGFYGTSPIAKPVGAAQGALTDSSVGVASSVIAPLTATYNSVLIVAAIASLAAQGNAIQAALVSLGLIKGSA